MVVCGSIFAIFFAFVLHLLLLTIIVIMSNKCYALPSVPKLVCVGYQWCFICSHMPSWFVLCGCFIRQLLSTADIGSSYSVRL